MQNIRLIIFDLDGTLLNTISDLANSTNHALEKNGFPGHPVEAYNFFIGNGINKLFERALPENEKTEKNVLLIRNSFIPYYDEHNMDLTEPYEGIVALLKSLQTKGYILAVASNKHQSATEKLIKGLFPDISFAAILGQRVGKPIKPDPSIVHDIFKITGIQPEETIYIGDSGVDMQTAANSSVMSIGVTWGFRPREELETTGAVYIVDNTADILKIIEKK